MNKFMVSLAIAATLAGCGGGGADPVVQPGPLEQVPASASASAAGLARYVGDLAAVNADGAEPVALTNFDPPQPDNTEPEPVS